MTKEELQKIIAIDEGFRIELTKLDLRISLT